LLTVQSVLTAAAVVIAVAALLRARHVARRLEKVVESYWELRYEYGQLRTQLDKLHGRPEDPVASGTTAFVPLSRLRSPESGAAFDAPRAAENVTAAIKRP
jgi:hypothetical protein